MPLYPGLAGACSGTTPRPSSPPRLTAPTLTQRTTSQWPVPGETSNYQDVVLQVRNQNRKICFKIVKRCSLKPQERSQLTAQTNGRLSNLQNKKSKNQKEKRLDIMIRFQFFFQALAREMKTIKKKTDVQCVISDFDDKSVVPDQHAFYKIQLCKIKHFCNSVKSLFANHNVT